MTQHPEHAPKNASDIDAAAGRLMEQAATEPVPDAIIELAGKLETALANERKRAPKAR